VYQQKARGDEYKERYIELMEAYKQVEDMINKDDRVYSESDLRKVQKELKILYDQNKELSLLNKRLKYELRKQHAKE
jgi:hypothetical protein